jgi:hypothetical protein
MFPHAHSLDQLVKRSSAMNVDRLTLASAGSLIVAGVLLGNLVHPYWYALAAFIGADLAQSSITGYCPLEALVLRIRAGLRASLHRPA